MKKDLLKGIGIGVCLCVLTMGIGASALAAGRSIEIDDGIKLTINGSAITPRDASGREVPMFSYNGTTYAPARALSEAMGFDIAYNSSTRTVSLTGNAGAATPGIPTNTAYIGEAKAQAAALKHAGVATSSATFVKTRLDRDNGKIVYDVEFYSGSKEYDYEIDAITGAVVEFDNDAEYVAPGQTSYIGVEKAKSIALAKVPGATVIKCELDIDHGSAKYEVELRSGKVEYEGEIDAVTGAILSWETD